MAAVVLGTGPGAPFVSSATAEMTYELTPMTSAGATTNAQQTVVPVGDAVVSLGNVARLRRVGTRSEQNVTYRLVWSRFVQSESDAFINELAGASAFNLSPSWNLSLTATGRLATTTQIDFTDPTTVVPQSSVAGNQAFLYTSVNQGLTFEPTPRWRFLESVGVSRVHFLSAPEGMSMLPTVTALVGLLRADLNADRNGFFAEARVTDFHVDGVPPMGMGFITEGHTFIGHGVLGWQREVTAIWSTFVQGGPAAVWRGRELLQLQPMVSAGLQYRRERWFAVLTAAHTPAINQFSALATTNEQVILRLAVPLTRDEGTVLAGFASYIYARMADATGNWQRAFDQKYVGAVLTQRFGQTSFLGTLSYGLVHQNGALGATGPVPSLVRQTVLLSIVGYFAWGAAAQPAFGGATM